MTANKETLLFEHKDYLIAIKNFYLIKNKNTNF